MDVSKKMRKLHKEINDFVRETVIKIFPEYVNEKEYKRYTGKNLNLKDPQTYSEKIRYIMLHSEQNRFMALCADKYNVRRYIEKKGLVFLLNTLYGVYENVDEIDIDILPNQFVLKCVHGSGYNVFCKNKAEFDWKREKKKIREWQEENYGYKYGELFYCHIKPRIICEKYLEDSSGELLDYKIHCFGGEPKMIQVDFDRNTGRKHTRNFYSVDWEDIPVSVLYPRNREKKQEKPECLKQMLEYARILSKDFPMVRVDFYYIDKKIIFGELTFAHGCGIEKITPSKYDKLWGSWIHISGR